MVLGVGGPVRLCFLLVSNVMSVYWLGKYWVSSPIPLCWKSYGGVAFLPPFSFLFPPFSFLPSPSVLPSKLFLLSSHAFVAGADAEEPSAGAAAAGPVSGCSSQQVTARGKKGRGLRLGKVDEVAGMHALGQGEGGEA